MTSLCCCNSRDQTRSGNNSIICPEDRSAQPAYVLSAVLLGMSTILVWPHDQLQFLVLIFNSAVGEHAYKRIVTLDVVMQQSRRRVETNQKIACRSHSFVQFLDLVRK